MLNCIDLLAGEEKPDDKEKENSQEIDLELLADKVAEILTGRELPTEATVEPENKPEN